MGRDGLLLFLSALLMCTAFHVTESSTKINSAAVARQEDYEAIYGRLSPEHWNLIKERKKSAKPQINFQDWVAYPHVQNVQPDPFVQQIVDSVDEEKIQATMYYLTNKFFTRQAESGEAQMAAEYLQYVFTSFGLETKLHQWDSRYSPNVVGILQGKDPKNVVIVSGHYDDRQVRLHDNTSRAPGADDNASGASMVVEVARLLSSFSSKRSLRFSVHFLSSSGEEEFLLGAAAYGALLKSQGYNIVADLNADMISYVAPGEQPMIAMIPAKWGNTVTATAWLNEFAINVTSLYLKNIPIGYASPDICCSDQEAFVDLGFPGISFFERIGKKYTDNPYYHTINDDLDHSAISIHSIALVCKAVIATSSTFLWLPN